MFESINRRSVILIVLFAIFVAGSAQLSAAPNEFIPSIGISNQVGSNAEDWQMGYSFGLDAMLYECCAIQYGLRLGYQFAIPDAESMLAMDINDVQVERREGLRSIIDFTILGRYDAPCLEDAPIGMSLLGGLGLNFVETSAIRLKGFARNFDTAVNREIHREANSEIVPSITVGVSFKILDQVQPAFEYQHIFTSDNSTGFFKVSLGLLARR
ncbi:MAG: hypothetical protein HN590_10170 [Calditrichaeota bacterium]|mgnify:FL=1|jgi:hypothetical protein|nr:hypothetical protein [Calditrichota bacterium]